jgi:hypothetical protein
MKFMARIYFTPSDYFSLVGAFDCVREPERNTFTSEWISLFVMKKIDYFGRESVHIFVSDKNDECNQLKSKNGHPNSISSP